MIAITPVLTVLFTQKKDVLKIYEHWRLAEGHLALYPLIP